MKSRVDLDHVASLVRSAHASQVDLSGADYVDGHVSRVRYAVAAAGGDAELQAAALLHDVLEDTGLTAADLADAGIPGSVVETVLVLTRREGERYDDYISRVVAAGPRARAVKRADLLDNLRPGRLAAVAEVDPTRASGLAARYRKALARIDAAEPHSGHPR